MSVKETEGNTQIPTVEDEDIGRAHTVLFSLFLISFSDIWPWCLAVYLISDRVTGRIPDYKRADILSIHPCIFTQTIALADCHSHSMQNLPPTPGPVRAATIEYKLPLAHNVHVPAWMPLSLLLHKLLCALHFTSLL